ncbi:hypothetical protein E2C01_068373 [Portunus trituberculatus]|uniref:Uncharacterized protein n=1 Tax=Portunus trituberculatus TaxID=210409 RepID=A0A5B7HZ94_PORTR|nr:hypothetical protein [Portunus trituberculatus]
MTGVNKRKEEREGRLMKQTVKETYEEAKECWPEEEGGWVEEHREHDWPTPGKSLVSVKRDHPRKGKKRMIGV